MDLWDVTKLLARRWAVSVPLLVLTLAAALWVGLTTEPDYKSTSHVTLLPPTVRRDPAAGTTQSINPWTTESLLSAVVTRLNSKAQHDALDAEGLSPIWEAEPDLRFQELVAIEVTARTEAEARATTQRLQEIVTQVVAQQQERYKLRAGEEITAIPFDTGDNVLPTRSKIYRVMIVIVGIGGVLTVALVVALDAFLRRRARLRQATPKPLLPRQGGGFIVSTSLPLAVRTTPSAHMGATHVSSASVDPDTENGTSDHENVEDTRRIVTAEQLLAARRANAVPEKAKTATEPAIVIEPAELEHLDSHEDATIVLPLSNGPWSNGGAKSDRKK